MGDEKAAQKGISDQIRACGLFFVSFIIFGVIPLIYHNFVFHAAMPMYKINPASAITILAIFHVVLILLLVSYYKTIFTDAGFVPYANDYEWQSEVSLANRFGLEAEVSERLASEKMPLNLEKKMDGRQRRCRKCNKFKPDRTHHCKYCGRCVLKMDHHCPWVNNCIGFRNYKFFMLFCTYVTLQCFYVTVILFGGLVGAIAAEQPIEPTWRWFEYIICFVLCLVITIVMLGFTGFHYSLVLRNVTTIEHVEKKGQFDKKDGASQYDQGARANFEQVFGKHWWLWFLPVGPGHDPDMDGTHFPLRANLPAQPNGYAAGPLLHHGGGHGHAAYPHGGEMGHGAQV